MSTRMNYFELHDLLGSRYPHFNVEFKKNSWLMKSIAAFLWIVTLGKSDFMHTSVTTIGYTVYVPDDWDEWYDSRKTAVLWHEAQHMLQYLLEGKKYMLKYLLWPLPLFYARCRRDYEIQAYAAEAKFAGLENNQAFEDMVVTDLSGPFYLYAWLNKDDIRTIYRSYLNG